VLLIGDLKELSPEQRVAHYKNLCYSLGLNHLTRPFEYILFKERDEENAPAKLQLYARKDCAEQLRKIYQVSIIPGTTTTKISNEFATTRLSLRDKYGKTDTATGIVYLWKHAKNGNPYRLSGQRLADAIMKSETKAKRRGTLSICGLGILDEHDLESVNVLGGVTPEGRVFEYKQPEAPSDLQTARAALRDAKTPEEARTAQQRFSRAANPTSEEPETTSQKGGSAEPTEGGPPTGSSDKPSLTIDWAYDEISPRVTGDMNVLFALGEHIHATWGKDEFWHIEARDGETIRRLALDSRFQPAFTLCELMPKSSSSEPPIRAAGGGAPSQDGEDHGGGGTKPRKRASDGAPPAVDWMEGVLDQVNTESGRNPRLAILFAVEPKKKYWLSCFDQALFPYLTKGKGQHAKLVVKTSVAGDKTYRNVIGAKNIGPQEFDDDGKTPCIQNKDREAGGGRTLFGGGEK